MHCKNCGSYMNEDAEFCNNCGYRKHTNDNKMMNVRKYKFVIIGIVIVLLFILFKSCGNTKKSNLSKNSIESSSKEEYNKKSNNSIQLTKSNVKDYLNIQIEQGEYSYTIKVTKNNNASNIAKFKDATIYLKIQVERQYTVGGLGTFNDGFGKSEISFEVNSDGNFSDIFSYDNAFTTEIENSRKIQYSIKSYDIVDATGEVILK